MRVWPFVVGAVVLFLVVQMIARAVTGDEADAPTTAAASASSASSAEVAAAPPEPDESVKRAYLSALTAIDPDVVHGKDDIAVNRGRNQCVSISEHSGDRARLVELTQQRFTSPSHPDGFGPEASGRILDVVRQYLCPTY